jgi:hypothetical protein
MAFLTISNSRPPVTLPQTRPDIGTEVLASIESATLEDSFVYVHCHFKNTSEEMLIRIWRTTFLIDRDSGSRSSLIHAENITLAPLWTMVPDKQDFSFLLIFSALPKGCTVFDLLEEIPQPGGFHVPNIQRNQKDVYHLSI